MKAKVNLMTWKPAENPTEYRKYDIDKEVEFEIDAENLHDACRKVYDMYGPEWTIGMNIRLENGDFTCHCVKDYYTYEEPDITDEEIRARDLICLERFGD